MPAKKKTTTKRKPAAKRAAKKAPAPANLCVNCAPIGHTQVIAMLLVAVFGLVAVMSIANFRLQEQQDTIQAQSAQIESLQQ